MSRSPQSASPVRTRNRRVLFVTLGVIAGMIGLVSYAPTLYQMFCALTGYGGTVQRATAPATPSAAMAATEPTVTILFDANVAPGMPWTFRPEQRQVKAKFGEPVRINYFARNDSDETVVGRAIFNVTPYKAAPYFFKIQCFCFTDEKLGPHQSAEMPVVLYVDDQILKDPNTVDVHQITLSYTFYRQKDLSAAEVAGARDLKAGSDAEAAKLKQAKTAAFDNDAPRK